MFASLCIAMALSQHPNNASLEQHYAAHTIEHAGRSYGYRLLSPEQSEQRRPLVVFLHGAGERGDDNTSQLMYLPIRFVRDSHLRDRACYVLAMQCPRDDQWATYNTRTTSPTNPTDAMTALMAALNEVIATHQVDRSRIYLTGLSMGGYGSWDLAARHPELFAAVVPICGGGHIDTAARLTDMPIWAFHGMDDNVVPEKQSARMVEAIRQAGGTPAYTTLEQVGHGSWHFAYGPQGAMEWMFAQRKSGHSEPQGNAQPSPTDEASSPTGSSN